MRGRFVILLIVAIAVMVLIAGGSAAWRPHRHHINPTPFFHSPCSVLDGRPCTPYFCSVFNHGPCIPEIDYPYGENLQLTIETVPSQDDARNTKARPRSRQHRRPLCRIALLLVAAAGRLDAQGRACR
jgi:hypothetical protein